MAASAGCSNTKMVPVASGGRWAFPQSMRVSGGDVITENEVVRTFLLLWVVLNVVLAREQLFVIYHNP